MMNLYLGALTWLAIGATGYTIDTNSCSDVAIRFLQENLGCGFEMVQQAVNEISGQISQPVQTLMDSLWAPSTDTLFPSPLEALKCRFDGDCAALASRSQNRPFKYFPVGAVQGQFIRGILSMRDAVPATYEQPSGAIQTDGTDVVFYCGTARYQDIKEPDGTASIKDVSITEIVDPQDKDPRKECLLALAWTSVSDDASKPSQITICPWFLSYAMKTTAPRCGTWRQKIVGVIGKPMAKLSTLKWPYTTVDLLSLFDKVMVHELTHTRHGGQTFDASLDGNSARVGWGFSNTGYGWKNCRIISTRQISDSSYAANQKPLLNADSYGLFASGVRIIQAGGAIAADGKVTNYRPSSKMVQLADQDENDEAIQEDDLSHLEPLFLDNAGTDGELEVPPDAGLWTTAFNATFFPEETTKLTEHQKRMVVAALMGNMHLDHE